VSGRYWGVPAQLFHKDVLYSTVRNYLYLGQKVYVEDTLVVLKLELLRDGIVEFTLNSLFNKQGNRNWRLFYSKGYAYDGNLMHTVIQYVMGFFKTKEYTIENVEKLQHLLLNKRDTLVSPSLVREMCKFYRLI
jgi:hypothetical protein